MKTTTTKSTYMTFKTLFRTHLTSVTPPTSISPPKLFTLQLISQQFFHVTQSLCFLVQLLQARVSHCNNFGLKDRVRVELISGPVVHPNETLTLFHCVSEITLRTGALTSAHVQNL